MWWTMPDRRWPRARGNVSRICRRSGPDVVEVRGYHHETPLIAFVGKGRGTANLTGEKVHVNQLLRAVRTASEEASLDVREFKVVAKTLGRSGWYRHARHAPSLAP